MPSYLERYVLPFAAALALLHVTPASAADACGIVNDAMTKLMQTPNHAFTESRGAIASGKTHTSERISTTTAAYIQVRGKWLKSTMTPAEALQMEKDAVKDRKSGTCQYVRDENIDGEAAALYSTHKEDDAGKSDAQVWISRKRGLPLRQVVHLDVGAGKTGESQLTTRYEYENVKAPEGVSH
jgi:hypothetical protein